MGCDIHYVVEEKTERGWVGIYADSHDFHPALWIEGKRITQYYDVLGERDYEFFGALAGVRCKGPEANGIPDDASELARVRIDSWGGDGHSHGHCTLKHFLDCKIKAQPEKEIVQDVGDKLLGKNKNPYHKYIGWLDKETESLRVVYWFDN